jgi:hypothetical protein
MRAQLSLVAALLAGLSLATFAGDNTGADRAVDKGEAIAKVAVSGMT